MDFRSLRMYLQRVLQHEADRLRSSGTSAGVVVWGGCSILGTMTPVAGGCELGFEIEAILIDFS